jgi:hypothetical protein
VSQIIGCNFEIVPVGLADLPDFGKMTIKQQLA